MSASIRVVFDANVFVQAVLSGHGPAAMCFETIRRGLAELVATPLILKEAEEVLRRLALKPKFAARLSPDAISAFFDALDAFVTIVAEPPHVWDLPRDPDDEVYIDLAIAVRAICLTTRDHDLLSLREDAEFRSRYPDLAILTATEFLQDFSPPATP